MKKNTSQIKKLAKEIAQGLFPKCSDCEDYFTIEGKRDLIKRRCAGTKPAAIVPESGLKCAPSWCPKRL